MLQGYDILWINCCGTLSWGYSELHIISNWLQRGGSVLVQGEYTPATAGPASIFGIYYVSGACTSGPTNNIDVPWLSMSPISGTLPGHNSLPVVVEFDATTLDGGAYQALLAIEHNDAAQPFPVELPVNLAVLPPRDRLQYLPLILVEYALH